MTYPVQTKQNKTKDYTYPFWHENHIQVKDLEHIFHAGWFQKLYYN